MAAAVVQAPQPEGNSEASAVRALVDCIKKEETVVTVNLDERIQVSLTVLCNCGLSLQAFSIAPQGNYIARTTKFMLPRGKTCKCACLHESERAESKGSKAFSVDQSS